MKKIIYLFVFALSLAFVGNASAQAPTKKVAAKTTQTPAKPAEVAKAVKPADVKMNKKMAMKKAPAKKVKPAAEKKTM